MKTETFKKLPGKIRYDHEFMEKVVEKVENNVRMYIGGRIEEGFIDIDKGIGDLTYIMICKIIRSNILKATCKVLDPSKRNTPKDQ